MFRKKNNIIITAYFIVAGLLLIYLINSLHLRSDMSFFSPNTLSETDTLIQEYLLESDANRLLFLQLGESHPNNKNDIKKLAELSIQLRKNIQMNPHFNLVENGQKSVNTTLNSQLYRYRYLLSPNVSEQLTVSSLKKQFHYLLERLQLIASPDAQKIMAESPLNIWFSHLKSLHNTQLSLKEDVWFNQNNQAVLLIKTKATGFSIDQQKKNVHFIEAQIKQLPLTNNHYTLSGAAMITLANSKQIAFQIQVISTVASVILALFLWTLFRSIKLLFLLALPLIFAILVGMSVVNFFYGYIHGISLAFGITIIGIAVDYPIHYFSHLINTNKTEDFSDHKNVMLTIWPKLRLGLVTTLIGFSAITFSSFSGLNQLGIFAMSGLISAALITRYLLPMFIYKNHLIALLWFKKFIAYFILFKNYFIYRVLIFILILIAIVYISTHEKLWENDLASLSPVSNELKQQDFKLRKSLNLPELRYLLLVSAETEQGVLQQTEAITPFLEQFIHSGAISFYDAVTRYLPSINTQMERQKQLLDSDQLYHNMRLALLESPFDIEAFRPFIDAVADNKQLKPLRPDDLEASLFRTKIKSMLNQKKGQWTGLIFLSGVEASTLTAEFYHLFNNSQTIQLIDIKQQTHHLVANYRSESVRWFLWGSVFIVLFLFFYIKKITALPALIFPFSGAIIFTLSLLLLFGYSISIFHLVTLLLVVGLGIDYSIFIYKSDHLIEDAQIMTLFSVLVCMLSSFIMFFSLSLSSIPVLKAIGLTASMGASFAFILSLIFSRPSYSVHLLCKH
ncbi:MAG: hypothetical protein KAI02_00230 [Gammaproteobacteria bacterium]|nr:hypothetical protein [Gammaproteobacteria bacterium]